MMWAVAINGLGICYMLNARVCCPVVSIMSVVELWSSLSLWDKEDNAKCTLIRTNNIGRCGFVFV